LLVMAILSASPGRPSEEERALHAAAQKGDLERVKALLRSGARVDARDSAGLTPLMAAVAGGRSATATALLAAGADANASTPAGWTALMEAAARGQREAARILLDAGADPDARNRLAASALDVAEAAHHEDVARLLRDRGSRGSGKSTGDLVCVRRWQGSGFCGVVEGVEGTRYEVRITSVLGCLAGCAADADCSAGRLVGGDGVGHLQASESLWIRSWCITHTGLPRDPGIQR